MSGRSEELHMRKYMRIATLICTAAMLFMACGQTEADDGTRKFYNSMNDTTEAVGGTAQNSSQEQKDTGELFIVADINSAQETIMVYSYESGIEYQY